MPTLEQIYDKLAELEQKVITTRDGFAVSDDIVADFFNINTLPGHEVENPNIELLTNVQICSGSATMINPAFPGESSLKSIAFHTSLEKVTSALIRPLNEDIRAQFAVNAIDEIIPENELIASFEDNALTSNVEVVPNNGQRDYGARLRIASDVREYVVRESFTGGRTEHLWFLDKSNIKWETIDLNNTSFLSNNVVLDCYATEPLNYFSMPQYSLNRCGIALWSDASLDEKTEIKVAVTPTSGAFIRTGLAIRMKDLFNGYFAILESDTVASYVRLYKVCAGFITKIAEAQYNGSFVIGRMYQVWAKALLDTIEIYIDDNLVLTHVLAPTDIVTIEGDFGVITLATSSVRYHWIEMRGTRRLVDVASEGVVTTSEISAGSDISKWLSVELNSSIVNGRVELDCSVDNGNTFSAIPYAIIRYPDAIKKKFSLESFPIIPNTDNKIILRARLYGTGSTGWLRDLKIRHARLPETAFLLDNVIIDDGKFKLAPDAKTGVVTMKYGFMPESIYKWDKFIKEDYTSKDTSPAVDITALATITADSEQGINTVDKATDNDLNTYWESKRGQQSWLMFEFAEEVELFSFRWMKKSITDGATFYKFQIYNATTIAFDDIHTYGFEVNDDVRHDFATPIRGTKFRLWMECVQPMSFGNARLIQLFGHSPIASTSIKYEYSYDNGITFHSVASLHDGKVCPHTSNLSSVPINQALKIRATLSRNVLTADLHIRHFGARFVGRDKRVSQITDLQYDLLVGDRFIMNCPVNNEVDTRCSSGSKVQLKIRFIINPMFLFEHLKPFLHGYKIGLSSSRYQAQISALQEHIDGVIRRADKDPAQDKLIDAITFLITQQIEQTTGAGNETDNTFGNLLNAINKEVAKNRSRVAMGDIGHLEEALPSEVLDANILLQN